MSNSIGRKITLTLFGESHGEYIGATIDNMPAGIKLDKKYIENELKKRRPLKLINTKRVEKDEYKFISGVKDGTTTGSPLTVLIKNDNIESNSYKNNYGIARPSHADYTQFIKYKGFEEYIGGGHLSGRLTAPIVLLGSIFKKELEKEKIKFGTHILELAGFRDEELKESDIKKLSNLDFPVLDDVTRKIIISEIKNTSNVKDSVGAILETKIYGVKAGVGDPIFDNLESLISYAIFSIPGIKGITFGDADELYDKRGSGFNDSFRYEKGKVVTTTNHNGGINGGITNGMPITFKTYVKPTPSIGIKQQTINFLKKKNVDIEISGRHDPCIANRVCPVIDNLIAFLIYGEIYG